MRISVADALGIAVDPYLRERFERDAREYNESIPSGARDVPADDDSIGKPVRESRERRRNFEDRTTRRNTYEDRVTTRDRVTYDNDRTPSTDSLTRIEDRTPADDSLTRIEDRTPANDSLTRTDEPPSPPRREIEAPRIERLPAPEVNSVFTEPSRDDAPKTRY